MPIRWSYALNQWRNGHDRFVLRSDHETAFKTVSISGFDAVELEAGSGRWEPLGREDWIELHYGSVRGLRDAMSSCALQGASSYVFDPANPIFEEGAFGRSVLNADDHVAIARTAEQYCRLLPQLGGDTLVVRALPAYAATKMTVLETVSLAAECWNKVGAIAASHGVRLALNVDCLSVLRTIEDVELLLEQCDADTVGLSIDIADAVIAGIDPTELFKRFASRTWHVQFKNTRFVDELEEYKLPNPEKTMIGGGGKREIDRWYWELGDEKGLVDIQRFYSALVENGFDGWIVVDSEQSPVPATSTMLNGWYVNNTLRTHAADRAA
ncbi:MAG: TIM barrel protein [Novosphingobium sp.]|nr:TIM barrel protein [Novosphingobium sp.]